MKYKRQKQIKSYEGLGFVEALISIMVAGIACVVLMRIAVDTIAQITKNEVGDEMTQAAIEMGSQVKAIAYRNNNETPVAFPPISSNVNSCFAITGTSDQPEFATDDNGNFISVCSYDSGGRDSCKSLGLASNEDLFGVFCITNASQSATGLVVGKAIIGMRSCDSETNCPTPDYTYYVLTKTLQK